MLPSICASVAKSPLVGIFQAGYAELNTQLRSTKPGAANHDAETKPAVPAGRPTLRSLDAVDRALLRATGANRLAATLSGVRTEHARGGRAFRIRS